MSRNKENKDIFALKIWMKFLNILTVSPISIDSKTKTILDICNTNYILYVICFMGLSAVFEIIDTERSLPSVGFHDLATVLYNVICFQAQFSTIFSLIMNFNKRKTTFQILNNIVKIDASLELIGYGSDYTKNKRLTLWQIFAIVLFIVYRYSLTCLYFKDKIILNLWDINCLLFLANLFNFYNLIKIMNQKFYQINIAVHNIIPRRRGEFIALNYVYTEYSMLNIIHKITKHVIKNG